MKFISEKAASKATPSKVIKYVLNEEKCCKDENGEIIMSTIGLDDDRPYSQQFKEIAELVGNDYTKSDRKYYHFKYTVSPDDYSPDGNQNITPEQLLHEAEDFVHENFPGYQAVITIQYHNSPNPEVDNEDHLHAHIVLNASSFDPEQNKIDLRKSDLDALRDYAYEAGLKYNLNERNWRDEVAEKQARREEENLTNRNTEPKNITAGEEEIRVKRGKDYSDYSFKEQYRIAIDEAKRETTNIETFKDYLKEHFHISTKITKQGNIKYKFPERPSYSSGQSLGTDYELPAVERALEETRNKPSDLPKELTEKERRALEWRVKFEEEYLKLKEWEKNEYEKQREEWLKADREKNLAEKEKYRNKTVLEHTASIYQMCREAQQDEILSSALAEKERAELEKLEKERQALANQGQYNYISNIDNSDELELIREIQDEKRQNYISTLQTTGTSLADKIAAANNLQQMNVEEGRKKDLLTQAQEEYGKDTRRHHIYTPYTDMRDAIQRAAHSRGKVYRWDENGRKRSTAELLGILIEVKRLNREEAKNPAEYTTPPKRRTNYAHVKEAWRIQNLYNAGRVADEIGANNRAEFELKVKQEGREYGKIKREYNTAKKTFEENVDKAAEEIFYKDSDLSVEDKVKKFEEVVRAEREKLQPIEDKFLDAKDHYIKCVRALETLQTAQNEQLDYKSPELEQEQEEEKPRRSKEEAERETKKQWSELRSWSDEATQTVASQPFTSKEADIKKWAKEMEKHGCQVRITANTVSVTHPESNQAVRTNRLGDDYSKEAIEKSISSQRNIAIGDDDGTKGGNGAKGGRREHNTEQDSRNQPPARQLAKERRIDDDER